MLDAVHLSAQVAVVAIARVAEYGGVDADERLHRRDQKRAGATRWIEDR